MRNLQLEDDVLRECYELEHSFSKRAVRYLEFVPVVDQIYGIRKYMKNTSAAAKLAYAGMLAVDQLVTGAIILPGMALCAAFKTPGRAYSACKSLIRKQDVMKYGTIGSYCKDV